LHEDVTKTHISDVEDKTVDKGEQKLLRRIVFLKMTHGGKRSLHVVVVTVT